MTASTSAMAGRPWSVTERVSAGAMATGAAIAIHSAAIHVQSDWWIDLDVYLRGATALLHGEDLYAVSSQGLSFTYAPFGATVFVPLSVLPVTLTRGVFTLLSYACYVLTMVVVSRRIGLARPQLVIVACAGMTTEPFVRGVFLGQINMILMAMVVVDLLVLPRGRGGVLVGLAAGIKLVPGVFIVYFALRRDWRGVRNTVLGLATSLVIGGVMAPRATWDYWTGGLLSLGKFDTTAVFGSDNQSLTGFLDRLLRAPSLPSAVTAVGLLIGVSLGVLVARRALHRGDEVAAVLALAIAGLLGSPVSWTHHFIWFAPVALVLVRRGRWWAAWSFGLIFALCPMLLLPMHQLRELDLSYAQLGVTGAYSLVGLVALVVLFRLPAPHSHTASLPTRGPLGERVTAT